MKYVIINTASGAEKNLNGTATIPIIEAVPVGHRA